MRKTLTRMLVAPVLLLACLLLPPLTHADITIDYVEGQSCPGALRMDQTVNFYFRLTNPTEYDVGGFTHGFRVYSPDGATWRPATADTLELDWHSMFSYAVGVYGYSITGSGADTLGVYAVDYSDHGIEPGFNELVWYISTEVYAADEGKTLCVDSSYYRPMGYWMWDLQPGGTEYEPDWGGPYCYSIGGTDDYVCGDVNNDDIVDMMDVIYLVSYVFQSGSAPPIVDAADMDGYTGLNISDVRFLVAWLFTGGPPPCSDAPKSAHVIGGSIELDHVDGLYQSTEQIRAGTTVDLWIRVTNDMTDKATSVTGLTNGFRIYSPDGAEWTVAADITGALDETQFDGGFFIDDDAVSGSGADTIGFGGYSQYAGGIPPGFSEVAYKISIGPIDPIYDGKTICIDSAWYPPVDVWMWATGSNPAIPVWNGPYCFAVVAINDFDASFSASVTSGAAPLTVDFAPDNSGSSNSWSWDFGDETTGSGPGPSHTYTSAGIYDVELVISDGVGSDELTKMGCILVSETEYADIAADVVIYPFGFYPDADLFYWCAYRNRGTGTAESSILKLLLPPEMESPELNDQFGSSISYTTDHDTMFVDLGNVEPSTEWTYLIPSAHLSPSIPIGTLLQLEMWVATDDLESDYDNNYYRHRQEIVDPNAKAAPHEKLAYPDGKSAVYNVGAKQRLNYTIKFVNNSDGTVYSIAVDDPLDPSLDWGEHSLSVYPAVGQAINCEYLGLDPKTGLISWFCDGINLSVDEEVTFIYGIDPKTEPELLPDGTEISNSGYVQFDLKTPFEVGPVLRLVGGCCEMRGDFDHSGRVDMSDIVAWVGWSINGDPIGPACLEELDMDASDRVDMADLVYWIQWSFYGGPEPADCY